MTTARLCLGAAAVAAVAVSGCADDGPRAERATAAAAEPPVAFVGPQGDVGQFIAECPWSHSSFDDPIVHPGHAGASHRHDFFGNTTTNAASTYEELAGAETTCDQQLDTAAYWTPSLIGAGGHPVTPRQAVAYYSAAPGIDPADVVAYPPGLMIVGGDATATEPQPPGIVGWSCRAGTAPEPAPPSCAGGAGLHLVVTFPDCWDGERLDSADHRDHVAYSRGQGCGGGHPVPVPQLQLVVEYGPVDPDGLSLASGPITGGHADFWNAWDQDKLETEVELCLRRQHPCVVARG